MQDKPKKRILIRDHMILVSMGLAVVYWIIQSALNSLLSLNFNFLSLLMGTEDIYSRLIVLCFFILFGSHAQYTINQRLRVEEKLSEAKIQENKILDLTISMSDELNLDQLFLKMQKAVQELLKASQCTIYLYDPKKNDLRTNIVDPDDQNAVKRTSNKGKIVAAVFKTGETLNISNQDVEKGVSIGNDGQNGSGTTSLLCMPIKDPGGKILGVTDVRNKVTGKFTASDEKLLKAFISHAARALENAQLFEDVWNMKNYNDTMLESITFGIISLDAHNKIVKCNTTAMDFLPGEIEKLTGVTVNELFKETNSWILESLDKLKESSGGDEVLDEKYLLPNGARASVNLSVTSLINRQNEPIGSLLILEDITKEKRLKSTISRYMTKEVADKLLESDKDILGGQTQEATIMFSDIKGFSAIAENLPPDEVVGLLNKYFSAAVDIVFQYSGILDKYIGDAIMAVYGAPFSSDNDPDNAVKSAIDIINAFKEFNLERSQEGLSPVNFSIGINSDEILSGNIGSEKRMDYTVIGDGVNVASRIENANKVYGTDIMISELTHNKLKGNYKFRELDLIQVKGRKQSIVVYEVLDHHSERSFPNMDQVLKLYAEGLAHYRRRNWDKGLKCFRKALTLNENDIPSNVLFNRISYYQTNPPPEDWNHVWVMESK